MSSTAVSLIAFAVIFGGARHWPVLGNAMVASGGAAPLSQWA